MNFGLEFHMVISEKRNLANVNIDEDSVEVFIPKGIENSLQRQKGNVYTKALCIYDNVMIMLFTKTI